jgi:hypothetical protein
VQWTGSFIPALRVGAGMAVFACLACVLPIKGSISTGAEPRRVPVGGATTPA